MGCARIGSREDIKAVQTVLSIAPDVPSWEAVEAYRIGGMAAVKLLQRQNSYSYETTDDYIPDNEPEEFAGTSAPNNDSFSGQDEVATPQESMNFQPDDYIPENEPEESWEESAPSNAMFAEQNEALNSREAGNSPLDFPNLNTSAVNRAPVEEQAAYHVESFRPTTPLENSLVGTSKPQFRRAVTSFLNSKFLNVDNKHLLDFLLEEPSIDPNDKNPRKLRSPGSRKHYNLIEHPKVVEMGHVISDKSIDKKSGEREHIVLQMAYNNQFDNVTVEHPSKGGGWLHNVAIDIDGVGVELQSAKDWEREGFLPKGTVRNAKRIEI